MTEAVILASGRSVSPGPYGVKRNARSGFGDETVNSPAGAVPTGVTVISQGSTASTL